LAAIPPVPAAVRAAVRSRLEVEGPAALHRELARRDPTTARRLMPGDRARVARALEVVLATGRALADWQLVGTTPALPAAAALRIFLEVDRAELYRRVEARLDAMLAAGALDEVRLLALRRLDPALPAMKAHGVPALMRHLEGGLGLEEAATLAKRDTRRYTKRQATWFRHQLPDWTWVAPDRAPEAILRALMR
jgi:tRNA dimethylallyltransferase